MRFRVGMECVIGHCSQSQDTETTLYYLQSRYYDPELGRFINADSYASTGQGILGNNMFAYCNNNPTLWVDPSGYFRKEPTAIYMDGGIGGMAVVSIMMLVASLMRSLSAQIADCAYSLSLHISQVTSDISNLLNRYGKFKCREAAEALKRQLLKTKTSSNFITIQFSGGIGYIWSNSKKEVISENGFHCGTEINGIVYCNIHPYGLPTQEWIADFEGTGSKMIQIFPIVP